VLKKQIEQRALERTVQNAHLIAALGVEPVLQDGDLHYPISLARLHELDQQVGKRSFRDTGVLRVKLFNHNLRLVYSDERRIIGTYAVKGSNVARALAGAEVSKLEVGTEHNGTGGRTLEVYVPLTINGATAGVLELYMSYDPVAAEIREDMVIVSVLLGVGLLLLFAAIVALIMTREEIPEHSAEVEAA
jgi:hypothetical protein